MQRCERIDRGIEDREEGRAAMEESTKISEGSRGKRNENHILNRSVASASDIMPLDTTCIFGLARNHSASRWLAHRPETGGREASASAFWRAAAIWDLEMAILYDFEVRLPPHSPANIGCVNCVK
jgi:hypothetical protein